MVSVSNPGIVDSQREERLVVLTPNPLVLRSPRAWLLRKSRHGVESQREHSALSEDIVRDDGQVAVRLHYFVDFVEEELHRIQETWVIFNVADLLRIVAILCVQTLLHASLLTDAVPLQLVPVRRRGDAIISGWKSLLLPSL